MYRTTVQELDKEHHLTPRKAESLPCYNLTSHNVMLGTNSMQHSLSASRRCKQCLFDAEIYEYKNVRNGTARPRKFNCGNISTQQRLQKLSTGCGPATMIEFKLGVENYSCDMATLGKSPESQPTGLIG